MRRLLITVVLLTGGLIAPASAAAYVPRASDRNSAVEFAEEYWARYGRSAADERGYQCRRVRAVGRYNPDESVLGWVRRHAHPCTIYLNSALNWADIGTPWPVDPWWQTCAVVIHEYGHLSGRGHSRNPNSIMSAELGNGRWWPVFPACRYDGDDQDGDGQPDW